MLIVDIDFPVYVYFYSKLYIIRVEVKVAYKK